MFFVFEWVFVYKWDLLKRWEKTTEANIVIFRSKSRTKGLDDFKLLHICTISSRLKDKTRGLALLNANFGFQCLLAVLPGI